MTKKVISKKATTVAKPATKRPTIKSLTEEVGKLTEALEIADKALQSEMKVVAEGKEIIKGLLEENEELNKVLSLMELVKAENERNKPWLVKVAEKLSGVK